MVWEPKLGCFCCAKPRTATLILGYLEVVLSVFGILTVVKMSLMPKESVYGFCHEGRSYYQDFDEEACYDNYMKGIFSSLVEQAIRGVIAALLIFGVNKRNQCLMLPYMILQVLGIVVVSLLTVLLVIIMMILKLWGVACIALLIGGGIAFLLTYFFLVVRVCYNEVAVQLLAMNNDLEIGAIHHNDPSVSDKFMKEPSGAPPVYSRVEDQSEPYPNYYMQKQPISPPTYSSPPPYSKLENVPTDPYSM